VRCVVEHADLDETGSHGLRGVAQVFAWCCSNSRWPENSAAPFTRAPRSPLETDGRTHSEEKRA
jgi:hypothetical protein